MIRIAWENKETGESGHGAWRSDEDREKMTKWLAETPLLSEDREWRVEEA